VIFQALETVRYYMAKAETTTGLKVKVRRFQENKSSTSGGGMITDHFPRLGRR
jgi:hypothetical protein